ncbi:HD-GYP domain-containing protein [Treponema sp.]|uniref:HD-GYP domain-containing protein n=1 Tax=Treponema sp. TaxID=166 RepID=UPI00298D79E9|nr:HD-GYP domain-containing protein [Treponema sp.]MCQ2241807.1 HD-GYP domain-containing protein [Treponema sp.]
MSSVKISDIKPDTRYRSPVTLSKMFIVTVPPCPITKGQLVNLEKWGFKEISVEEEVKAPEEKSHVPSMKKLGETETVDLSEFGEDSSSTSTADIPEKFKTSESVDISAFDDNVPKHEPEVNKSFSQTTTKATTSLSEYLSTHDPQGADEALKFSVGLRGDGPISEEEDTKHMEAAQKTYEKFMDYINKVYTRYATHKEIQQAELNGKVLELCNFVRETKKFILRISPSYEARNKNFLISHSMRTAVLAIVIGMQLNMPYEKLIELGVASILHEIGQIRLPPQLYMNDKPLTPAEKAQMATHTVVGYNIVKQAGFPLTIQLGVLDHHERETGTGYPRKLTGASISTYAKIIAVACSYEAITAPRHFKEARTTYEGMIEMLKNSNHLYDDTVVKALLYSVSLYPIGAYVYLANGKVAQVVDVSPSSPKNPIVKIIGGINKDGSAKMIQTDDQALRIVRVMTEQETNDLMGALGEITK